MQPAPLELLTVLSRVLSRWGRWYLFGAQAVTAYGVPRLSADVYVTVQPDPADPERFVADMEASGFVLRVGDADFVRGTRVMPFVHTATGMPLDVVLAGSGLEDEFLNRAVVTDVGGTTVPLIDLQDLIVAKILAGRPKDLVDAQVPRSRTRAGCRPDTTHAAAARGGSGRGRSRVRLRIDLTRAGRRPARRLSGSVGERMRADLESDQVARFDRTALDVPRGVRAVGGVDATSLPPAVRIVDPAVQPPAVEPLRIRHA